MWFNFQPKGRISRFRIMGLVTVTDNKTKPTKQKISSTYIKEKIQQKEFGVLLHFFRVRKKENFSGQSG